MAGGCTNWDTFIDNPMYSFKVDTEIQVKFHATQNTIDVEQFDTMTVYATDSATQ